MKRLIRIAEQYSAFAEDSEVPLGYYLLTFLAFVILRDFLELFSDSSQQVAISPDLHFHFGLWYACVALTMIWLFSTATGETIPKTARLVLCSFYFILAAPIIDLVISGGQGYDMSYLLPGVHRNLFLRYLTFFGSFEGTGATPGLKIEIAAIIIASLIYFKAKKVSTLKSLLFAWLMYTSIFIYAIAPFIIKATLDVFHLFEQPNDMLYVKAYLIVAFVLLLILVCKWNRRYFVSLLKDIRPFRQIHFLMMFAFGIVLGPSFAWRQKTLFDMILVAVSILWACLFALITNNLEDQEIDQVVNKLRPLVSGAIPLGDYRSIAVVAGLLALVCAAAVSYYTLLTILLFMGLYSLYSMPPIRFKRVPFFSKLIISINSLAFTIMGYVFAGGEAIEFPPLIVLWFVVFFTAAMNFIDIKDYEGDRLSSIKTLPVLWGLKKSQRILGLFFFLAYAAAPFAVGQMFLLPVSIGAGGVQYWLVSREDYQENRVFILYLMSFVVLLILLGLAEHLPVLW